LQVIGLLAGNRSLGIGKHLESILAVAKQITEYSVTASRGVQLYLTGETSLPFWKEAYHSIAMMERLLLQFPELYFKQNTEVYLPFWLLHCSYNCLSRNIVTFCN
jgi:U3 small nucleolar RNA-associated protein 20